MSTSRLQALVPLVALFGGRRTGDARGAMRGVLQGVGAVLLALTLVALLARHLVDVQLRANGEDEAEHWMDFARTVLPSLDAAVQRGRFDANEVERLRLLAVADEVRFLRILLPGSAAPLFEAGDRDTLALDPALRPEAQRQRRAALEGKGLQVLVHHGEEEQVAHMALVWIPLQDDGQPGAVMELHIDQGERAEDLELSFLLLCAAVAVLALLLGALAYWRLMGEFRRRLFTEGRIRYLAAHDALSGALNRASLMQRLQHCANQAGPSGFAVLCVDLDRFKEINDAHGHAAGDEVLRVTTLRLRALLRSGDEVARLGGDEFAVLLRQRLQPEELQRLGERVVVQLSEPVQFGGRQLVCGASVGGAVWQAELRTADELLTRADAALYQAKADGRGVMRLFDAELEARVTHQRALARDLGEALARNELSLHFQGVYSAQDGGLQGFEALMRWAHPQHGAVSPTEFIPLAEEYGLIQALGAWALREACALATRWPEPLKVAVNVSAAQFAALDLPLQVQAALSASGLAPQRLQLELTESLLLGDAERTLAQLRALKALGLELALDDFGTGYSSLSYLWRYPFDRVKVDRSFVAGLSMAQAERARSMVKAIVEMAHALGLQVTAEGVEQDDQRQQLRALGCDTLQGFLLARPQPVSALPFLR